MNRSAHISNLKGAMQLHSANRRTFGLLIDPIQRIISFEQSAWLEHVSRPFLDSGRLNSWIESGVSGAQFTLEAFRKSICETNSYDREIREKKRKGIDRVQTFEELAIADVQKAADLLLPIYHATKRTEGFASLEVTPTAKEIRRIWKAIGRPNVMLMVPGAPELLSTIEDALRDGIQIHVHHLFSAERYQMALNTYINALERRLSLGLPVADVRSVAGFSLSRIDVKIDEKLNAMLRHKGPQSENRMLRGTVAVAISKMAYQIFKAITSQQRWALLSARGAVPQKLAWSNTATKNPEYSDVMYAESLVGPNTIISMSEPTMRAFQEHGTAELTLEHDLHDVRSVFRNIERSGIALHQITDELLKEHINKAVEDRQAILDSIERKAGIS
jgi:transaldolase